MYIYSTLLQASILHCSILLAEPETFWYLPRGQYSCV